MYQYLVYENGEWKRVKLTHLNTYGFCTVEFEDGRRTHGHSYSDLKSTIDDNPRELTDD